VLDLEVNLRPMTELRLLHHVNGRLAEALRMGLDALVEMGDQDEYLVPSVSRGGTGYRVTVNRETALLECGCKAGEHLPFCIHRAAVTLFVWRAQGLGVEIGPDGVVYRVHRERADRLAYEPMHYPALIADEPPLAAYEGDV